MTGASTSSQQRAAAAALRHSFMPALPAPAQAAQAGGRVPRQASGRHAANTTWQRASPATYRAVAAAQHRRPRLHTHAPSNRPRANSEACPHAPHRPCRTRARMCQTCCALPKGQAYAHCRPTQPPRSSSSSSQGVKCVLRSGGPWPPVRQIKGLGPAGPNQFPVVASARPCLTGYDLSGVRPL